MFMYALKHHLIDLEIRYLTPPQHKIDAPSAPAAAAAAAAPIVAVPMPPTVTVGDHAHADAIAMHAEADNNQRAAQSLAGALSVL
ncbi:hypothetical protein HKX48_006535 [Thoreauomyces humboldtii]|nr:hypothetical protein HKX48_006535 [Thoreauomyces humboldtii]